MDIHNEDDYANDKLFVSQGGSCVAIEPDGNIISVCRRNGDIVRGKHLIEYAVKNGGDRLDAFGGLYGFYVKNGFKPISWTPFDEQYAPEGWDKEKDQKEPVIFYRYVGKPQMITYKDFINNVSPSKDYDIAKLIRDRSIK